MPLPARDRRRDAKIAKANKTYNTRDSLVVTHPTTSLAIAGLSRGERTGSRVFQCLWSYVSFTTLPCTYKQLEYSPKHQWRFVICGQRTSTNKPTNRLSLSASRLAQEIWPTTAQIDKTCVFPYPFHQKDPLVHHYYPQKYSTVSRHCLPVITHHLCTTLYTNL